MVLYVCRSLKSRNQIDTGFWQVSTHTCLSIDTSWNPTKQHGFSLTDIIAQMQWFYEIWCCMLDATWIPSIERCRARTVCAVLISLEPMTSSLRSIHNFAWGGINKRIGQWAFQKGGYPRACTSLHVKLSKKKSFKPSANTLASYNLFTWAPSMLISHCFPAREVRFTMNGQWECSLICAARLRCTNSKLAH